jgi:hypothetical protein
MAGLRDPIVTRSGRSSSDPLGPRELTRRRHVRRRSIGAFLGLAIGFATIGGTGSPAAVAAEGCDAGRQKGPGGHEYQLICTKRTFAEAKAAAVRAGGHLVTIGSAAENAFVFDLANVPQAWSEPNIYGMVTGPWIGFAQDPDGAEPAGGWKWVTGESVGYTNWAAGEPNDFEDSPAPEDRAVLWGPGGVPAAVWNDIGQAASIPSIIEFEPKLSIDWTMPARLTPDTPSEKSWHLFDGLPRIRDVNPDAWKANVFLLRGNARYACPSGIRFAWKVEPLDGGRVLRRAEPGCKLTLSVTRLGRYKVIATKETLKAGRWRRDADPTASKTVLVKDWLIVGLGDSNGSGEGNPGSFFYTRCNRGTASYQFQTALYVERQDPRTSVTFLHAACSGARIEHLVDRPYPGTRPANPPLSPQIEQVSFLLSQGAPKRSVDAALVSVGVNDLAFGPLMTFCVKHARQNLVLPGTPCPDKGALIQLDAKGRVSGFRPSANGSEMRIHLQRLLRQLPDRYPELARELKAGVAPRGGLGLSADRVFITQYPDFMHGADGDYCDTRDDNLYFLANWDRSTWTWLSLAGAQLNQRVRAAASRFGWRAVAPAAIGSRGWCNLTSSLFRGIGEAIFRWNLDGPFHPIAEAHLMARDAHTPLICRKLYKTDDCTGRPR